MNNITKSNKIGIVAIFVAISLVGSVAILGGNMVFAKKLNDLDQLIVQPQKSHQNAQCASGTISLIACNNLGLLFDNNTGNEAAAQQ